MITATIEGLDVTISGLGSVGPEVREAAYYAVIEVMKKAWDACKDTIDLSDHTLRSLAQLKHPYGKAHPAQIHDPDVLVHNQGGKYLEALKATPPVGLATSIIEGRIDMSGDPDMETLDRWIQEGTSKMRARPWMQWIVDKYGEDFADLIEARITDAIKGMEAA